MLIRLAGLEDAAVLARHRADMFKDMGALDTAVYGHLVREAERYFRRALPAGDYLGWLATPLSEPTIVVAGAGVQVRDLIPRPDPAGTSILAGRQALVANVYTDQAWRRQGIAELLMRHILSWTREQRIGSIVLHASGEGRALYERLGFVATNEMRFGG